MKKTLLLLFFSFSVLSGRVAEVPGIFHLVLAYLIFVIILEMVLRLAFEIKVLMFDGSIKEE